MIYIANVITAAVFSFTIHVHMHLGMCTTVGVCRGGQYCKFLYHDILRKILQYY